MGLSQSDLSLLERFKGFSLERQLEIADAVQRAADESGMGVLYDSILERVQPKFMSQAEFKEWSGNNDLAHVYAELFGVGVSSSAYVAQLDKIVVPDRNPYGEMSRLLTARESAKSVIAHEALHAVQCRSSKITRLYLLKPGQETELLSIARSVIGDCTDDVARVWAAKYCAGAHFRQGAFEITARCLTPEFTGETMMIPHSLLDEHIYSLNVQQVRDMLMLIVPVFGYFRGDFENAADVDIAVNRWMGEHGSERGDLVEGLNRLTHGSLDTYGHKGMLYLMRRSEKLDKVYERTKKALKQYGLK